MKLLFELSGENPTLPFAELECVCRVTDCRLQVAVGECQNPRAAHRLSMAHVVLEYLGECDAEISAFRSLLQDLGIKTARPFAGRVRKVHNRGERKDLSQREFERLIGTMISGPVDLKNPEVEYRAILSEDRCYFGRVLFRINRGGYDTRNPGKRDFFHPGVMMPRMVRVLVNISCAEAGDILLDPFCGTGGILIEAGLLGTLALGSDCDPMMTDGSRRNARQADLLLADAANLPFASRSIDVIVTDFPYGQSVCIRRDGSMDRLYADALGEIGRVLKPGRRAVVVTHRDIAPIASQHMTILQTHAQRVHKSLTRQILVLRPS